MWVPSNSLDFVISTQNLYCRIKKLFLLNFIYNISLSITSANLAKKAICTWLAYKKNDNKHNNNDKKSYSLCNVVSVREEFWVSPWFVSHAKNVIRVAYDDGGHFHCYIVDVRFFNA